MNLNKGRPIKIQNAEIIIHSDAEKSGDWGGTLPGNDSRGSVEQGGSATPHIRIRNESSQIGDRFVLPGEKTKTNLPKNRQCHSSVQLGKNGTNKEGRTQQICEGNLGVFNSERDRTYCRISSKLSRHSGKLGVKPHQGLERVEIASPDICKDNSDDGKTKRRSFYITPVRSTLTVHVMETGPLLHGSGCPGTKIDTYVPLYFSPIFSNRESFKENPRGQSYCDSRYSNMIVANLVPLALENEHKKSDLTSKQKHPSDEPSR